MERTIKFRGKSLFFSTTQELDIETKESRKSRLTTFTLLTYKKHEL